MTSPTAADRAAAPAAPTGFGPSFVVVVASALCYFVSIGMLIPVLPRHVEEDLGGSGFVIGLVVGVFALSAAALRPAVGSLGDRRGRRILVVGGALVAGASIALYGLPGGLAVLLLMRLVTGVGEAAFFVGAATAAQDLAPIDRRGQAASFFSISVYGGLAAGPPLGDWLLRQHGASWVWTVSALACVVSALIGLAMPNRTGPAPAGSPSPVSGFRRYLHPAALRPGVVLALSATAFAGYGTYVPVYVDEIGVENAGAAFTMYGVIVLVVRIVFSRLPDQLGTRRGPLLALVLQGAALVLLAAWHSAAGLYVASGVLAIGTSLLYPALFPAVVAAAPEAERSRAIATFTLFFDLSQGFGAPILGLLVTEHEHRGAFLAAAVAAGAGYLLHRRSPAVVADVDEPCPPSEPGG